MIERKIKKAFYSLERAEVMIKHDTTEAIMCLEFVINYCKEAIRLLENN